MTTKANAEPSSAKSLTGTVKVIDTRVYKILRAANYSAKDAWDAAYWHARAKVEEIHFDHEYDLEPWDGDCPAPEHNLCCYVYKLDEDGYREVGGWLASLGMVGVDSLDDPYLLDVAAQLFCEAIEHIEEERDRQATMLATELESRATFAGGSL